MVRRLVARFGVTAAANGRRSAWLSAALVPMVHAASAIALHPVPPRTS